MSDLPETDNPQTTQEVNKRDSPPRSSPSLDAIESELKLSRKREREVSVEPVTTPSATNETDPMLRGRKDSAIPLKKNRRHLDTTEEEEDGGGSGSGSGSPPTPPTLASPRQEMKRKVRQISRGVEDINWKNMNPLTSEKEFDVDADIDFVPPELTREEQLADLTASQQSVDHEIEVEKDDSPPKSPDGSALSRSVQDVQSQDATMHSEVVSPEASSRLRAGSESNDKGLKRKFLERGTSHGPPENGESAHHVSEPLKRPRDESDKDDNPRETKRPTPPPSPPRPSPPSPKVPKKSGFMAYASSNSPFASVKGQNIFMSGKGTTTPPASSSPAPSTLSTPAADFTPTFGQSSSLAAAPTPAPTPAKRTGFEAFASSSSPFATAAARAKSPALGSASKLGRALSPPRKISGPNSNPNPFASYAGPSQGFALPLPKKARAGTPDSSARSSLERTGSANVYGGSGGSGKGSESGDEDEQDEEPTTFGERLRAGRDDDEDGKWDEDNKIQLTEQDVLTGEEEEETLHQVRGKLFSLDENQWRERGTGLLKLNVRVVDGTGARLIMRKDAVHALLLNITLFPGMRCTLAQDPRYIRFSAIENGNATTYNLKVSNAKIASDLLEEINANIPS
ncbi:hypothetical protein CVT25_013586 [Psilocybe cyanescens]|uniref:RanBD1 domain-containing protein n=1 Tax=Psilocybe cyanescens TaxID=93625 RepID=A0A409XT51_PSICY|nr:hypothetical protein CVT25_013586 [Psilocybe cyanescens]